MKIVTAFIFIITIAVILLVSFAYSGFYDVSASSPHGGFTNWLASIAMHAPVRRRSTEIVVPDPNDKALQIAGISDVDAMCKSCHGAPGCPAEAVGQEFLVRPCHPVLIGQVFIIGRHLALPAHTYLDPI